MILDKIVENKKREIEENRSYYTQLSERIKSIPSGPGGSASKFLLAISRPGRVNLIAEIKKFSPSNPKPVEGFDAGKIARVYMENGVSAISVVTDRVFFGGNLEMLSLVKSRVSIPILCKDFIVDRLQVKVARACGADAILLIMRILADRDARDLSGLADSLGMDSVFEVHSREEIDRAVALNAQIIGINNRDLDTLQVNLDRTLELIGRVPEGKTVISESGVKTHEDVLRLKDAGVNAILVGETLLRSSDIAKKIKELLM